MTEEQKRWQILYGGTDLEVELADFDKQTVETATVKVVRVALKDMQKLGSSYGQGDKEAKAYLAEKNQVVFPQLTDESILKIIAEGRKLNAKNFGAWFDQQAEAMRVVTGKTLSDVVSQAINNKADQSA